MYTFPQEQGILYNLAKLSWRLSVFRIFQDLLNFPWELKNDLDFAFVQNPTDLVCCSCFTYWKIEKLLV